jgi:phenylalanyl-tRNA synthetase beta chain
MRLVVSWLRDFVDVKASAQEIAETLGLRGFEVASVEVLGAGDAVIDFEVTANRPDCLSVIGLAREVATAFDLPMTPSPATAAAAVPLGESDRVAIAIEDPELCPRYAAAVADLSPTSTTPDWMSSRLQAAGVRPISPIVDVTNYVLLELGQPMHAFDLDKLAGQSIRIRRAAEGETIRTLDGVERKLEPGMLVIADKDHPQAVAGVMGGAASEVSSSTRAIVFESAFFKPASVRLTSKELGLKTEASARFERGADVSGPVAGLQRAIALMERIGAGRVSGPVVDRYPVVRQPARLHLRRARLAALLGAAVPDRDVERILGRLGLEVSRAADGWDVLAPTFRVDLLREVDLIEEVGRHHGFDRLEAAFPPLVQAATAPDPRIGHDQLVRRVLTAAGLSEAVTFGFIESKAAAPFESVAADPVAIANPLSAKFDTLRPSLLPGLVDAVAHNRRHGRRDVFLFEIGTRFTARGETRAVALACTGAAAEHWANGVRDVDFFDVKGIVERLADSLGVSLSYMTASPAYLVAGHAAGITIAAANGAGSPLGVVGLLAPSIADGRGAPRQDAIFVAEIDLDAAWAARVPGDGAIRALPRHPFVVRDLSIVVDDALPAEIIRGTIQAAGASAPAPLVSVRVFDRYAGKGVPNGRVSLSLRLTFQAADRTLTDAEVQQSVDMILAALVRKHGAALR